MLCDLDQGRSGNMRRSFRRRRLINLNGPREVRALLAVHPSMRFARVIIRNSLKINMKSYTSGRSRHGRGRSRRRGGDGQGRRSDVKAAPQKKGLWSRIAGFFAAPEKSEQRNGSQSRPQARISRKPEPIEVTSMDLIFVRPRCVRAFCRSKRGQSIDPHF